MINQHNLNKKLKYAKANQLINLINKINKINKLNLRNKIL